MRAREPFTYTRAAMLGYFVVGPGERLEGSRYPWGWEKPDYDDSAWVQAEIVAHAGPRGAQDSPSRWFLIPRNIPLMEETPERLARVVRSQGVDRPAISGRQLAGHRPREFARELLLRPSASDYGIP